MTVAQQIEGCRRASDAGIELSVTAILGLAGRERSLVHAAATGDALSAIDPRYIGLLTLMLTPGTAMERKVATSEVVLPDSVGMLRELREIVAHLDVTDCLFRCNHASNYLPIGGRLPGDKAAILEQLDRVLGAPESVRLRPGELAPALAPSRAHRSCRCEPYPRLKWVEAYFCSFHSGMRHCGHASAYHLLRSQRAARLVLESCTTMCLLQCVTTIAYEPRSSNSLIP